MDLMSLLARGALVLVALAFISGFIITAVSGSVRAVKIWLGIIGVFGLITTVAALVLTGNLFVYLMFQYITVILILCFIVIAGAVCGGGLYSLIHSKPPGLEMKNQQLSDFLPLDEFCQAENLDTEKVLGRLETGYYEGGKVGEQWYVSKTELSALD